MRIGTRAKLVWVAAFYFAEGLPYGVINDLLPVFFRSRGVSLAEIGLLSLIGLPWTLKFLWAPLIDRVGTRRQWILSCQLLLGAFMLSLVLVDGRSVTPFVWLLLGLLATLSATQDVAIDAYTIEMLDERELGIANGIRVTAYRVAMIVAGGALVALAAPLGWSSVFISIAALLFGLAVLTSTVPPTHYPRVKGQPLWQPARALLARPAIWLVALFILTFKLGDFAMLPMIRPFWVDHGFGPEEIGLVVGTLGMIATIGGALLGGALTSRWGTFRALWVLGLVQALSNLGYFAAAAAGAPRAFVYSATLVEQFTGGLGTAAFLAFLMSLCEKRYAATQYAVLSALFVLGRSLAGAPSGAIAQEIGYAPYFLLTFAFALPAFALLPFVRTESGRGTRD